MTKALEFIKGGGMLTLLKSKYTLTTAQESLESNKYLALDATR